MPGGTVEPHVPAEDASRSAPPPTASTGVLSRLTARQEGRLRAHLDERLAALERDERTQFSSSPYIHPATSPPSLRSSPAFPLSSNLSSRSPPFPPSSYLRISYLLTLTGVIPSYLSSLPLLPPGAVRLAETEEAGQEEAERVLRLVLGFLREVDRGWEAVLGGRGWVPPDTSVKKEGSDGVERDGGVLVGGKPVKVDFGGQVDQTERIRLRSIILSGRERMIAWSRTYVSFPGASYPSSNSVPATPNAAGIPTAGTSDGGDSMTDSWEMEIMNMWDGSLAMLSEADLSQD